MPNPKIPRENERNFEIPEKNLFWVEISKITVQEQIDEMLRMFNLLDDGREHSYSQLTYNFASHLCSKFSALADGVSRRYGSKMISKVSIYIDVYLKAFRDNNIKQFVIPDYSAYADRWVKIEKLENEGKLSEFDAEHEKDLLTEGYILCFMQCYDICKNLYTTYMKRAGKEKEIIEEDYRSKPVFPYDQSVVKNWESRQFLRKSDLKKSLTDINVKTK